MVRAKFLHTEALIYDSKPDSARKLVFRPIRDTEIPEDQQFTKWTPLGCFEMYVTNPAALAQFELGKYYYLDFTPVPEAAKAS